MFPKRLFLSLLVITASLKSMPAQSLRPVLHAQLVELTSENKASVLIWDIRQEGVLTQVREEVFHSPHCVGSLLKPFLVLAAAEDHLFDVQNAEIVRLRFLPIPCTGIPTARCPVECWYKKGHGPLDLKSALAVSCNQFFFQLAQRVSAKTYCGILEKFGLTFVQGMNSSNVPRDLTQQDVSPELMIGLNSQFRLIPFDLLRAYLVLINGGYSYNGRQTFFSSESIAAMRNIGSAFRLGALEGTSQLAQAELPENSSLIGKTGTSPRIMHQRLVPHRTDGWFVGAFPAEQPAIAVMVYFPNGLGAKNAAPLGGKTMRAYLQALR
jgi:cell division protein FtsI/penicillin-binding protein 2